MSSVLDANKKTCRQRGRESDKNVAVLGRKAVWGLNLHVSFEITSERLHDKLNARTCFVLVWHVRDAQLSLRVDADLHTRECLTERCRAANAR